MYSDEAAVARSISALPGFDEPSGTVVRRRAVAKAAPAPAAPAEASTPIVGDIFDDAMRPGARAAARRLAVGGQEAVGAPGGGAAAARPAARPCCRPCVRPRAYVTASVPPACLLHVAAMCCPAVLPPTNTLPPLLPSPSTHPTHQQAATTQWRWASASRTGGTPRCTSWGRWAAWHVHGGARRLLAAQHIQTLLQAIAPPQPACQPVCAPKASITPLLLRCCCAPAGPLRHCLDGAGQPHRAAGGHEGVLPCLRDGKPAEGHTPHACLQAETCLLTHRLAPLHRSCAAPHSPVAARLPLRCCRAGGAQRGGLQRGGPDRGRAAQPHPAGLQQRARGRAGARRLAAAGRGRGGESSSWAAAAHVPVGPAALPPGKPQPPHPPPFAPTPPSPVRPHPTPQHCVRLLDSFEHTGPHGTHVCEVFESLGDDLLTLIKWVLGPGWSRSCSGRQPLLHSWLASPAASTRL